MIRKTRHTEYTIRTDGATVEANVLDGDTHRELVFMQAGASGTLEVLKIKMLFVKPALLRQFIDDLDVIYADWIAAE